MLWNATEGICVADGAIKNKARVSPFCCDYVEFPDCSALRPSGHGGFSAALQCFDMTRLNFFLY